MCNDTHLAIDRPGAKRPGCMNIGKKHELAVLVPVASLVLTVRVAIVRSQLMSCSRPSCAVMSAAFPSLSCFKPSVLL